MKINEPLIRNKENQTNEKLTENLYEAIGEK